MLTNVSPAGTPLAAKISTSELAGLIRGTPQNIRAVLCKTGNFCGLTPTKIANGRLLWDAEDVARLVAGEVHPGVAAEAAIKKELVNVRAAIEREEFISSVLSALVTLIVEHGTATVDEVLFILKKMIVTCEQDAAVAAANFEVFATKLRSAPAVEVA